MRKLKHPVSLDLATVLYALSDPARLAIVKALASRGEEKACCEFECRLSKPTMSHHFKVLRESGITKIRVEGTRRFTSLCRRELDRHFPGLLSAVLKSSEK